jgi:hypothetical protein
MSNISVHPERHMSIFEIVRSASLVPVNILSVPGQFWRAKSLAEFELITGCYIYYDRIGSAA